MFKACEDCGILLNVNLTKMEVSTGGKREPIDLIDGFVLWDCPKCGCPGEALAPAA